MRNFETLYPFFFSHRQISAPPVHQEEDSALNPAYAKLFSTFSSWFFFETEEYISFTDYRFNSSQLAAVSLRHLFIPQTTYLYNPQNLKYTILANKLVVNQRLSWQENFGTTSFNVTSFSAIGAQVRLYTAESKPIKSYNNVSITTSRLIFPQKFIQLARVKSFNSTAVLSRSESFFFIPASLAIGSQGLLVSKLGSDFLRLNVNEYLFLKFLATPLLAKQPISASSSHQNFFNTADFILLLAPHLMSSFFFNKACLKAFTDLMFVLPSRIFFYPTVRPKRFRLGFCERNNTLYPSPQLVKHNIVARFFKVTPQKFWEVFTSVDSFYRHYRLRVTHLTVHFLLKKYLNLGHKFNSNFLYETLQSNWLRGFSKKSTTKRPSILAQAQLLRKNNFFTPTLETASSLHLLPLAGLVENLVLMVNFFYTRFTKLSLFLYYLNTKNFLLTTGPNHRFFLYNFVQPQLSLVFSSGFAFLFRLNRERALSLPASRHQISNKMPEIRLSVFTKKFLGSENFEFFSFLSGDHAFRSYRATRPVMSALAPHYLKPLTLKQSFDDLFFDHVSTAVLQQSSSVGLRDNLLVRGGGYGISAYSFELLDFFEHAGAFLSQPFNSFVPAYKSSEMLDHFDFLLTDAMFSLYAQNCGFTFVTLRFLAPAPERSFLFQAQWRLSLSANINSFIIAWR